jgi:hypothetical protein
MADHPAVLAWQTMAGGSSVPEEVQPVQRAWKKKAARVVYRLKGVIGSGATVIAKPCTVDEAARTALIYREILPYVPVRCPQMLGSVDGERSNEAWLFLEEVAGEEYRPSRPEHRRLSGAWLAILHTAASEAGATPRLAESDYLYDTSSARIAAYLRTARDVLLEVRSNPAMERHDLGVLRSIATQCDDVEGHWPELGSFCLTFPSTLVHGDFCVSNMLVHEEGGHESLVVFDWQRAGWASPAFDLTRFLGSWVDPDMRSYLSIVRRHWPAMDVRAVRRLAYVGEILRWIEAIRWEVERLRYDWVVEPMSRMRIYERWMDDNRRAAPWHDSPPLEEGEWRSVVPYSRPMGLPRGAPVHSCEGRS